MPLPRLDLIRDLFVFSCYTGLAYIDVKNLKKEEILQTPDGIWWIKTLREKTKVRSQIPLLQTPIDIIQKHLNLNEVGSGETLFSLLSNQRTNSYLKEIAMLCRINKNLTFHVARHTFATTVTLQNGVPIESVSKMLGHTNIKTTQHYAKVLDSKISQDMVAMSKSMNLPMGTI
jgi:integrase